jgi:excisionase family DNA binding protein
MENPFDILIGHAQKLFAELEEIKQKINKLTEREQYMRPDEAAKMLGISTKTLDRWQRLDRVKAYRVGGRTFYKESEIHEAMKHLRKYKMSL